MRGNTEEGKETRKGETQTPRLRAPVGTPGETGVGRHDGRKPEAGEGAGPGAGGVTGKPVAGSEREKHERHVSEIVLGVVLCRDIGDRPGKRAFPGMRCKANE